MRVVGHFDDFISAYMAKEKGKGQDVSNSSKLASTDENCPAEALRPKLLYTSLAEAGEVSMTSLLTHNVAHSTRHSVRPKTNNQPFTKFLSLALS